MPTSDLLNQDLQEREPADMADPGADEPSPRTESPDGEGRVSEDRSLLHQRLAIRELIDTEVSYLHMLQLCASDIRGRLQQLPQGDLDVLFSNIDDIVKVNSRFLHGLQETASREEDQVQLIGNLFLEFQEELEQVYKVYCASYDQALLLVDTYRKEPELQREIQGIIEAVVPQAGSSGLSFLLVIPLQRITKYPLLLQKILENTLPDASAYPVLQRATHALQDVNANINEYKRRKEVASKYTKVEQLTLRERLARINTHTLSKKTTRLSQLLKQEAGLVPRTEDKEFDDLEERFHWVSLCVKETKNNVAAYLDNLEAFLHFRPQECDLDVGGGPVVQYCSLTRDLQLQAFPEFKRRLEGLVWQPLCSLAKTLAGPQNLIKKRLDKLLDFERVEEKLLEVGSVSYEEEVARHTYQALNSMLVAELPQFNQLAMQWLRQILCTFVALQRDLAKQVLQRAEGSLAQLPHHHIPELAFRKLVEDALGQTSHQLHSFQKNFEKVLPPPTIQPLLPGAERQVQALLSRYGPGKLYQVTSNISGAGTLDLTLPRGQVVALLQNKDTKGNSSRWLVDTGGHRGYVPAGKLELYRVVPRDKELRGQAGPHEDSRHLTPEPTPVPVSSVPTMTQVVAVYPFLARSSHEVSLQAGQPVTVLEAQDKKGNPEWSLVEVDGQRGYVPSSFLARAPSPAPWGWSLPS
ncbi:rho guanine nucleotide exchange factor 37 isoform X2 [Equus przewalskii]|uniref:Rho guanine nucleotide exchange factor 37 n=2 Tax=Equus TaxID=9789 RepID=A0A9L0SRF7_HORSE|nr:PREDICTED: rho guanine nucleotide exchange factor 37 isoform X2 [Equus przewalskii]XP_023473215.1 rho guanine nucleotide exchange factor 37 isoform X2 [Equus caballus]XP_023473216.1 rho guanine nucleotide exchange factor 37 isoform X2 [Equus caballus]XP_023473217.1 rho guanine nucleotide exchange factor 37 isoform X2 [Equus caballus]XP_023473218.1 rho guanine nucleotide exchange factor 37 isoform X2 [Equus caballus]